MRRSYYFISYRVWYFHSVKMTDLKYAPIWNSYRLCSCKQIQRFSHTPIWNYFHIGYISYRVSCKSLLSQKLKLFLDISLSYSISAESYFGFLYKISANFRNCRALKHQMNAWPNEQSICDFMLHTYVTKNEKHRKGKYCLLRNTVDSLTRCI